MNHVRTVDEHALEPDVCTNCGALVCPDCGGTTVYQNGDYRHVDPVSPDCWLASRETAPYYTVEQSRNRYEVRLVTPPNGTTLVYWTSSQREAVLFAIELNERLAQ